HRIGSGRPRPVEIEIPPDILQATDEVELIEPTAVQRRAGDTDVLDAAARALGQAKAPLIYPGGGILRASAWSELHPVAQLLEAPVATTTNGRGALSDRHHLAVTDLAGMELVPTADVILVVGSRFLAGAGARPRSGRTLIRLDIDPEEITRSNTPDIAIE